MKRCNGNGRFSQLVAPGALCAAAFMFASMASAQPGGLNNQPYNFGGKGLGISNAGKQVLLNEKIYGIRPDNLMVGRGGQLLYAEQGPSGSAIVYDAAGVPVPGYHGRGWQGSAYAMMAYQTTYYGTGGGGAELTTAALGGWTGMVGGEDVAFANYLLPVGFNTLDTLLWQVSMLSPH